MGQMMQNPMQKIQQVGQVFQQPENTTAPIQEPEQQSAPMYDLNTIGQQVATLQTQVAALQTYVNQLSDYLYAHHEEEKPELQTTPTSPVKMDSMTPEVSINTPATPETPAVKMEASKEEKTVEAEMPQTAPMSAEPSPVIEMPEVAVNTENNDMLGTSVENKDENMSIPTVALEPKAPESVEQKPSDYVVVEPTQTSPTSQQA